MKRIGETRGRPRQSIKEWLASKGNRKLKEQALVAFLRERLDVSGADKYWRLELEEGDELSSLLERYFQEHPISEYAVLEAVRKRYKALIKESGDRKVLPVELDSTHRKQLDKLVKRKLYEASSYAGIIRGLIRDGSNEFTKFQQLHREEVNQLKKDRKKATNRFEYQYKKPIEHAQKEAAQSKERALKLEAKVSQLQVMLQRMDNALYSEVIKSTLMEAMLSLSDNRLSEVEGASKSSAIEENGKKRYKLLKSTIGLSFDELFSNSSSREEADESEPRQE